MHLIKLVYSFTVTVFWTGIGNIVTMQLIGEKLCFWDFCRIILKTIFYSHPCVIYFWILHKNVSEELYLDIA